MINYGHAEKVGEKWLSFVDTDNPWKEWYWDKEKEKKMKNKKANFVDNRKCLESQGKERNKRKSKQYWWMQRKKYESISSGST